MDAHVSALRAKYKTFDPDDVPDVEQFLEDGKKHIDEYRCRGGWFFNKRLLAFYSLFTLVMIGGSFILSLYILPWLINMNPDHIVATLGAS